MIFLARLKLLLSKHILLLQFCKSCGRVVQLIWHCDDELWQKVTGEKHGGGVRCTRCFDREAGKLGLLLRWTARSEGDE